MHPVFWWVDAFAYRRALNNRGISLKGKFKKIFAIPEISAHFSYLLLIKALHLTVFPLCSKVADELFR
jgi:hypothetical protein